MTPRDDDRELRNDKGQTCAACGEHFKYQYLYDDHYPCRARARAPTTESREAVVKDVEAAEGTSSAVAILVDARAEAEAQIARALQIVCDADDHYAGDGATLVPARDYTADELDTLFFSLSMAQVQLKKVPGGQEAHDRTMEALQAELRRRRGLGGP